MAIAPSCQVELRTSGGHCTFTDRKGEASRAEREKFQRGGSGPQPGQEKHQGATTGQCGHLWRQTTPLPRKWCAARCFNNGSPRDLKHLRISGRNTPVINLKEPFECLYPAVGQVSPSGCQETLRSWAAAPLGFRGQRQSKRPEYLDKGGASPGHLWRPAEPAAPQVTESL
jgi:hypothetical protein